MRLIGHYAKRGSRQHWLDSPAGRATRILRAQADPCGFVAPPGYFERGGKRIMSWSEFERLMRRMMRDWDNLAPRYERAREQNEEERNRTYARSSVYSGQ